MASLPESEGTLYAGELEIRLADGLVLAGGRVVRLSVREFDLIVAMARRDRRDRDASRAVRDRLGRRAAPRRRSVDVYV